MGGLTGRTVVLSLAVTGLLLSVLLPAGPAAAHNSFTGSSPKNGARVEKAPEQIQLRFLSTVDPGGTKVTVMGPDNVPAEGGEPVFDGSKIAIPFDPGIAGLYLVRYETLSSDGHTIKGEIRFTLTVGATPSVAPTPSTAAASPSGPAGPVERVTNEGATPWWPWALGGAVVLAALGGGLLLIRRRATG